MEKIINDHKAFWFRREFLFSVVAGFLFFTASLLINYAAGSYATRSASNAVTDIILDNIPVVDTGIIFVEGTMLFILLVAGIFIKEPWRMPFILKTAALFVMVRSFFIVLTHIGPMPDQITIGVDSLIRMITFGGDLFFSGHTGMPFCSRWLSGKIKFCAPFFTASIIAGFSVLWAICTTALTFSPLISSLTAFSPPPKTFRLRLRRFLRGLPAISGNK